LESQPKKDTKSATTERARNIAEGSNVGVADLFSEDSSVTEQILSSTSSGDADVNDCTLQPTIHDLPFGGVGDSGMGKYHGEWGFRAYSNARGILSHSTKIDIGGLRYPPYDHNRILREIAMPS
jgi:aldehyde dehydrogenase (NAD+)